MEQLLTGVGLVLSIAMLWIAGSCAVDDFKREENETHGWPIGLLYIAALIFWKWGW